MVLIYFTLALLGACCLVGAIVRLENAKLVIVRITTNINLGRPLMRTSRSKSIKQSCHYFAGKVITKII